MARQRTTIRRAKPLEGSGASTPPVADRTVVQGKAAGPSVVMRELDGQVYYATRDGEVVRVPSSGPANEIVRTGSFWPFPREADTTR